MRRCGRVAAGVLAATAVARVLRHVDVDQRPFPVDQFGAGCDAYRRKEDPGAAFPWEAFRAALGAP